MSPCRPAGEPVQDTTAYSQAIYATDTIGLGRYFDLIAGLRLDRFAASYNQLTVTSGALLHLDHVDHVASPHVALVYKPTRRRAITSPMGPRSIRRPRRSP